MAVELEIRDGEPKWWLSPDIWVVPGTNPEGPAGTAVAGDTNYLWAQVHNRGSTSVSNATVRFYWADPSTGFDRTTAHLVGTSFVSLAGGESADVLCLTPWIPEFVNDGHECVLAEAFHSSSDPLPAGSDFDVPTERQVAQRNLSVIEASKAEAGAAFFAIPLSVFNVTRLDAEYSIRVQQGTVQEAAQVLRRMGLETPREEGRVGELRLVAERCPTWRSKGAPAQEPVRVKVAAHRKAPRTLIGQIERGAALVHIEQRLGKRSIGGMSALVLAPSVSIERSEEKESRPAEREVAGAAPPADRPRLSDLAFGRKGGAR